MPFVTAAAIELLGEVEGEGLHRADTLVIVDEQMAETVCCLLRHHRLRLRREGEPEKQDDSQGITETVGSSKLTAEPAECALRVHKQPQQG